MTLIILGERKYHSFMSYYHIVPAATEDVDGGESRALESANDGVLVQGEQTSFIDDQPVRPVPCSNDVASSIYSHVSADTARRPRFAGATRLRARRFSRRFSRATRRWMRSPDEG